MDQLVNNFLENPISYAIAFAIVIIALAVFIKIAGNPLSALAGLLKVITPYVFAELRGRTGRAGVCNVIMVFALLILSVLILIRPSLIDLFGEVNVSSQILAFLTLVVDAIVFVISLRLVADVDRTRRLLSADRGKKK